MSQKVHPINDIEKFEILVNGVEKTNEIQELFEQCVNINDLFQFLDNLNEKEKTTSDKKLHEYIVKENETIIGLSLSFNIKYITKICFLIFFYKP